MLEGELSGVVAVLGERGLEGIFALGNLRDRDTGPAHPGRADRDEEGGDRLLSVGEVSQALADQVSTGKMIVGHGGDAIARRPRPVP